MKKIAVFLFCILVCVGLLLFVSIEYRIAAISVLVILAIIDAIADVPQKRRALEALEFVKSGILQILRPPLSFVLWLGDVAGDVSPVPRLAPLKGLARAELKQHWADSWMTAPARYFRSRTGGK